MPSQEIFQLFDRGDTLISLQVNFGQHQLRMGEVGRIEPLGDSQVLLGEIRLTREKVGHAELRIRQRIAGPPQYGIQEKMPVPR